MSAAPKRCTKVTAPHSVRARFQIAESCGRGGGIRTNPSRTQLIDVAGISTLVPCRSLVARECKRFAATRGPVIGRTAGAEPARWWLAFIAVSAAGLAVGCAFGNYRRLAPALITVLVTCAVCWLGPVYTPWDFFRWELAFGGRDVEP